MSARFGRNKRRRAREQIAALAQSLADTRAARLLDWEASADMRRSLEALREDVRLAKQIAAPFSVLFKPETLRADFLPVGERVEVDTRPFGMRGPISFDDPGADYITFERHSLEAIVDSVEYDRLRGMVHAIVEYKGGAIAYAISDGALAGMSVRMVGEFVQRHVAPMLVRGLTEKLCKLRRT